MKIRTFKGTDIPAILALWNETMVYYPINEEAFKRKILLDVNFDPDGFFLAEEDGQLVGFIYALKRHVVLEVGASADKEKGFVVAMGFREGEDFREIGNALLKEAEAYINKDEKRTVMVYGYAPEYFYQGIDKDKYPAYAALLEENGYVAYSDSASLKLDLDAYRVPPDFAAKKKVLSEEGFYIGAVRLSDIPSLFQYVLPGWRYRYRRLLKEDNDFGKIRVVVHKDAVIGCILFGDAYDGAETINSFSVDTSFRGKGLGKMLLADCLLEMQKKGLHAAYIRWGNYRDAAGAVYEKAGFRKTGIYIIYKKD